MARLLINALLAAGGYPWTVIRGEQRAAYLEGLEQASVEGDLRPFAEFVAGQLGAPYEGASLRAGGRFVRDLTRLV